jgi:magnesium transporter
MRAWSTALCQDMTVGEALAELRTRNLSDKVVYFYVTDADQRLVGVVSTRKLLISQPSEQIRAIMDTRIVTILSTATVLEACESFARHRFLALPVVDNEGRLTGVIDIGLFTDEAVTGFERRQAERVFQLMGVHVALGRRVPSWRSFLDRFPWLLCNIVGGMLCALVISHYEAFVDTVIVLALFIPVVLALAESVSMQSMTLTLVGLESQRIHWPRLWLNLRKEFVTAAMLGMGCGAVVGLIAFVWKGSGLVSFAIGASITLAMLTACLLGVLIPTTIRRLNRDPRIAAGPIVLAAADVITLSFYFGLSGWFLGK